MADKLEMKIRKEHRDFLKRKALQYRRQAMKHAYDNPKRLTSWSTKLANSTSVLV